MRNKPVSLGRLTTLNWFRLSGDKVGLAKAFLWVMKMKSHNYEEIGRALIEYHELQSAAQLAKEKLDRLLLGSPAPPVDPLLAAIVEDRLDFYSNPNRWVWRTSRDICELIGLPMIDQGVMRRIWRCVLAKNGGQSRRSARNNQVFCPPLKSEPEQSATGATRHRIPMI